jgi:hypothetical protein
VSEGVPRCQEVEFFRQDEGGLERVDQAGGTEAQSRQMQAEGRGVGVGVGVGCECGVRSAGTGRQGWGSHVHRAPGHYPG